MKDRLYFWLLLIFTFDLRKIAMATAPSDGICKSIEITIVDELELLRNCTIIVGHVRIVDLQLTKVTRISASSVEEITDYLLIYRVQGLQTLQRIFPRLKIIRGQELLFDKYSLVIFENRELENLGLISLLRVQKGDVKIKSNPILCYVDTINWLYLLGDSQKQKLHLENKPSYQCPLCNGTLADIETSTEGSVTQHCWNLYSYQRKTIFGTHSMNCSSECGLYGCDDHGACCSRRCLTGCSDSNCEVCGTFKQNGRCVDFCGFSLFLLNKRECVLMRECRSRQLIPHGGVCLEECPKHYKRTNQTGFIQCELQCDGNFVIHTSQDLSGLKECSYINGSLTIELTEIQDKIIENLEDSLSGIKNISGYLKIKDSPQIVSLQFLRSLTSIRGEELIEGKYALYVVNNYHLEQIWNRNQNVRLLKGRVYFHLNPRLCYEKILKLVTDPEQRSPVDISPNSNGERVICGSAVRELHAIVEDFNATAARIKVNPMSSDDKDLLLGYLYYYKEAPVQNITHYDGRHGCGHDNWLMDISPNRNVRHVIGNLKPYTQYAYFVKTLTMTDYHIQLDAYSVIQYFTTMATKPGPVAKVYYHSLATNEIMLHWWPPHSPNGKIDSYLISYNVTEDKNITAPGNHNVAGHSDTSTHFFPDLGKLPHADCTCQLKEPFYSGPLPEDENYYNKEQLTYDEALPNFIYVSRVERPLGDDPTASFSSSNRKRRRTADENDETQTSPGNNKVATSDKEESLDSKTRKAELDYKNYRLELERKALALQDTGIEDFPIIKPKPLCPQNDASVQYQVENACRSFEQFEGVRVSSKFHHYVLRNLSPEITYLITVRACLEDGECGGPTTIAARTISKKLQDFLNNSDNMNYTDNDDSDSENASNKDHENIN